MCIVTLRLLFDLVLQVVQMSEVKEGRMLLARVKVMVALRIFKRVTRFAACKSGSINMGNNLLYSIEKFCTTVSFIINVLCIYVGLLSRLCIILLKPAIVPTHNHELRIYHPITLWCRVHQRQAVTPLRGIELTLIHLHQCIL